MKRLVLESEWCHFSHNHSHITLTGFNPKTASVTILRVDFSLCEQPPSYEGLMLTNLKERETMVHCQSPQSPPGRTGLSPGLGTEGDTQTLQEKYCQDYASGAGTKQLLTLP